MGKCFKDLKVGDTIYIITACCARKEKITNVGISKNNKVCVETDYIMHTDCGDRNNLYFNINGDDNMIRAQHEFSFELVFSDIDVVGEYIQENFVKSLKD